MGKFALSWQLLKESYGILMKDKEIMWFPILSGIINLVLFAGLIFTYLFPFFNKGANEVNYLVLLVYYVIANFVIFFFNTAVITCASIRLKGKDPTVMDGLNNAFAHKGKIFSWALLAATVGLILNAIENKSENIGKLVAGLLGMAWGLMTFFIIPVLIFEDKSVIESLKSSGSLFKKTWGENVLGQLSMSFAIGIISVLGIVPLFLSAILAPSLLFYALGYLFLHLLVVITVGSALGGIYTAALYNYATTGKATKEYSAEIAKNAFKRR